jgi:hypothetical protein
MDAASRAMGPSQHFGSSLTVDPCRGQAGWLRDDVDVWLNPGCGRVWDHADDGLRGFDRRLRINYYDWIWRRYGCLGNCARNDFSVFFVSTCAASVGLIGSPPQCLTVFISLRLVDCFCRHWWRIWSCGRRREWDGVGCLPRDQLRGWDRSRGLREANVHYCDAAVREEELRGTWAGVVCLPCSCSAEHPDCFLLLQWRAFWLLHVWKRAGMQNITTAPQELRYEDYSEGRKAKNAAGAAGGALGGFGTAQPTATTGFGGFGAATTSTPTTGFGATTSAFGAAKPAFGAATGTPSVFGSAQPAATGFGSTPTTTTTGFGGFGSAQTTPGVALGARQSELVFGGE